MYFRVVLVYRRKWKIPFDRGSLFPHESIPHQPFLSSETQMQAVPAKNRTSLDFIDGSAFLTQGATFRRKQESRS